MLLLLFILLAQNQGFLSVDADQDSLAVYVDNDSVGITPLIKYPLAPDQYHIGFFPQDSIEEASWELKNGSISALWKLARYSEGIVKVWIASDTLTSVELSYKAVEKAPGKAKLKVTGCLGGAFLLGVLTTVALYAIF
jgi:hypothetical protein